jgi:class 3 adenylate cyclase
VDTVRTYADRYPHAPAWRAALAFCLVEIDRPDDARRELELLAGRDFEDLPRDGNFLTATSLLAQVAARLGDRRRCALLEALLVPYVDRQVVLAAGAVAYCSAAFPLGLLRAAQGDVDGGLRLLAQAQEDHERRGARPYLVTTAVEQVRLLLQRGSPDDVLAAGALLATALPQAREVGMSQAAERLSGLATVLSGLHHEVGASDVLDLTEAPRADGQAVTLLLTDVAGSAALTERLGERAVHGMLLEHRNTAASAAALYGGLVLKSLGDGVLCAFPDAASALRCAAWLRAGSDEPGGAGLQLRIGVHTGPVLRQGESMYGRSMILAFRIAEQAAAGEVLVSAATREAVESPDLLFDEGEALSLKGFTAPQQVHRLRRRVGQYH